MEKQVHITLETYQEMSADYSGYCTACGEETSPVEPDAEGYHCDACGEDRVVGPDIALLIGLVS